MWSAFQFLSSRASVFPKDSYIDELKIGPDRPAGSETRSLVDTERPMGSFLAAFRMPRSLVAKRAKLREGLGSFADMPRMPRNLNPSDQPQQSAPPQSKRPRVLHLLGSR